MVQVKPIVSILVFLDQALKDEETGISRVMSQVSILVFLDQALKAARATRIPTIYSCFNPCFPGSSAESIHSEIEALPVVGFNPCFPGSSAESIPYPRQFCFGDVFQSLFSWIKR